MGYHVSKYSLESIKSIRSFDRKEIIESLDELYSKSFGKIFGETCIPLPCVLYILLDYDDRIIASLCISSNLVFVKEVYRSSNGLYLFSVCVLPEERRKNYMIQLISIAINDNLGTDIYLEVLSDNIPAIKLYDKMGFRKIGTYIVDGKSYDLMIKIT